MSDIETYLTELRSHLRDLAPRRADEIVAEARTHLQSRAAQLQAAGLDADQATSQAARNFGEPAQVAVDLLAGNSRHLRPSALRVLGVAWASAISLAIGLGLARVSAAPESWSGPLFRFLSSHTGLDPHRAYFLLFLVQLLPAAYLFGLVAGRRFYWLAAASGFFWIGAAWAGVSWTPNTAHVPLPARLFHALIVPALAALVLGGAGWLGARLAMSSRQLTRRLAHGFAIVCGLYSVALALRVLEFSLGGPDAQFFAAVVPAPVALTLLAAARKDRRLSLRLFLLLSLTLCAAGILVVAAATLILMTFGLRSGVLGPSILWLLVVAVESIVGLIALLIYAAFTRLAPKPNLSAGT
jgi:hypothetical protein